MVGASRTACLLRRPARQSLPTRARTEERRNDGGPECTQGIDEKEGGKDKQRKKKLQDIRCGRATAGVCALWTHRTMRIEHVVECRLS
jgi:hypothetical protein